MANTPQVAPPKVTKISSSAIAKCLLLAANPSVTMVPDTDKEFTRGVRLLSTIYELSAVALTAARTLFTTTVTAGVSEF